MFRVELDLDQVSVVVSATVGESITGHSQIPIYQFPRKARLFTFNPFHSWIVAQTSSKSTGKLTSVVQEGADFVEERCTLS
jgi:hypothetical protein